MFKKRYLTGMAALVSLFASSLASGQEVPGSLDTEFSLPAAGAEVNAVVLEDDGRMIIAGAFTNIGPRIAAILEDGTPDPSFAAGGGANSGIRAVAIAGEDRIYIGGTFTSFAGQPRAGVARLTGDGSPDPDFDPGSGFTGAVGSLLPLPDGRLLVGGQFYKVQGQDIIGIAALDANGDLDGTFAVGGGTNNVVNDMILLSGDRVLIGGAFSQYNGQSSNRIAMLNPDGTLAATFDAGTGFNGSVTALHLTRSGKILVAGTFSSYNGTPRQGLALLNEDGSLDPSFNAGSGPNSSVKAIVEDENGLILLGGDFTTVNGMPYSRIARLRSNGAVDVTFDPGEGPSSTVNAILEIPGADRLVIGGSFTAYDNAPVSRLAAIVGGSVPGGYEAWVSLVFPPADQGNAEVTGPNADPDGDGVANVLEYAFDGQPLLADREGLPASGILENGGVRHLSISFIRVREAFDLTYVVQASSDLRTWTDIWSSRDVPFEGEEETAVETVVDEAALDSVGKRFLRVNVVFHQEG